MPTTTETETVVKKILPYLARLGYDIGVDIDFETATPSSSRYTKGYVDLLVTCQQPKPRFLIEAKRMTKKSITDADRRQALDYGASLNVPFVVVTNGSIVQCLNTSTGLALRFDGRLADRIPRKDELKILEKTLGAKKEASDIVFNANLAGPFRPGLPLRQLNQLFELCHNAIRKIEKNEEHAFADFSKLLFLKLLEEKAEDGALSLPYSYRFHELAARPKSERDQVLDAVQKMIKDSRTKFGEVLADELRLKKPETCGVIVERLASVSFRDSSLDSKGAAFEYFVRATLKGKRLGQYFTPRALVKLMVTLVGREKPINALLSGDSIKVLDPACGTGGFLVYYLTESLRELEARFQRRAISKATYERVAEKLKSAVFLGLEASPGVACAAKMNMIVAGDGHTNIQHVDNSLSSSAPLWNPKAADIDIVITNPPFGTSEEGSLSSHDRASFPISGAKGQHLFLQKMVLCTKPGGEICTVIDEGVLNTESSAALRRWVLERCDVLAVVRLPDETFKPNKINVRSSVLWLRRLENDDPDLARVVNIRFVDLKTLGYDGSGEVLRGFDYERLQRQFVDAACGTKALDGSDLVRSFDVPLSEVRADSTLRLDLRYWDADVRGCLSALVKAGAGDYLRNLVTAPITRGRSPSAESYVDRDDGYALVVKAGSNINKFGEVVWDGDFVEKAVYDAMPAAHVCMGDVLLSSTGDGTLGKAAVYESSEPAIADGHVTIIRLDKTRVDPKYVADYLRVGFGAQQIERLYTGSTGLIELTPQHVSDVYIDLLKSVRGQIKASSALREDERNAERARVDAADALAKARARFRS